MTGDLPRRNAGWETVATSALVRRCLEADPGRRPSAAELAAEARASVPPDA
ncbi:MAG: hypothetical protein H6721_04395 [Sandaracinus sp.]|nr:hypothetical protein [Sandaracinus sp.]